MQSLDEKLAQLELKEPIPPNGWFRWMHDTYADRCWRHRWTPFWEEPETIRLWNEVSQELEDSLPDHKGLRNELVRLARKQAHSFGRECPGLLLELWDDLERTVRGEALAGATQRIFEFSENERSDWSRKLREGECEFSLVSLTEVICNLIAAGSEEELDLMEDWLEWLGDGSVSRLHPDGSEEIGERREAVASLGDLALDRCLEAAVRVGDTRAAVKCLAKGADPNITILSEERSFRSLDSALTHAVAHHQGNGHYGSLVDTLLEWGASVEGSGREEWNRPLFLALYRGDRETADRLLLSGTAFDTDLSRTEAGSGSHAAPAFLSEGSVREEMEWLESQMKGLLPLCNPDEASWFFIPNAQGGRWFTFFTSIVRRPYSMLDYLENKGFPFRPCAFDLREWISGCDEAILGQLFEKVGANPVAMEKVSEFRRTFLA